MVHHHVSLYVTTRCKEHDDGPAPVSTLLDALAAVPDPRHTRGKRLEWIFILGVITCAVLSHQRSAAAIAHWVQRHAPLLLATFQPRRERVPSEATIRRTLRYVDVDQFEYQLAQLREPTPGYCHVNGRSSDHGGTCAILMT